MIDKNNRRSHTSSESVPAEAKLAPGLEGVEGLDTTATKEDVEKGDSTKVVRLEYDEYDPSQP